jgi:KTSC domain
MRSQQVDSSVALTVGYDERRCVLKVRFRNGRAYYYLAVPPAVYRDLLAAPSLGKYLNEVIKPAYRAVRAAPPRRRRR